MMMCFVIVGGSWSRQGKHGRLTDPMAVRQSIQNISKAFIEVHRQST